MGVEAGEDVVVMPLKYLEMIIRAEESALISSPIEMPKQYFQVVEGYSFFPDEILFRKSNQDYKLFLDHNFYSANFMDMVFVRYCSVDQSIIEEGGGHSSAAKYLQG